MSDESWWGVWGQVWFDGGMRSLADAMTSAGLKVNCGRYAIRIEGCSHFVLTSGGDPEECNLFDVDADADTEAKMVEDTCRVSNGLRAAKIRHEFDIYKHGADETVKTFAYGGKE